MAFAPAVSRVPPGALVRLVWEELALDLTISGRHVAVTDAMRDHARQRAEKFEHFTSHLMGVKVTLSVEGERQMAEFIAHTRGKGELVAKAVTKDMYASIDQAAGKLEKQLDKLEARLRDRREKTKAKHAEA